MIGSAGKGPVRTTPAKTKTASWPGIAGQNRVEFPGSQVKININQNQACENKQ